MLLTGPYGLFLLNMNERLMSDDEAAAYIRPLSWAHLHVPRTVIYPISGCPWCQLRVLYLNVPCTSYPRTDSERGQPVSPLLRVLLLERPPALVGS